MLLLQDMLVYGYGNRIGLRHWDLDLLNYLNGIGLLDLHGIWLFHGIRDLPLGNLGHYLVHRHLDLLLDWDMDGIGFRDLQPDHIGHLHGHGMGYGQWHLLDHMHWDMLGDF